MLKDLDNGITAFKQVGASIELIAELLYLRNRYAENQQKDNELQGEGYGDTATASAPIIT
jgi:hypothetical protein